MGIGLLSLKRTMLAYDRAKDKYFLLEKDLESLQDEMNQCADLRQMHHIEVTIARKINDKDEMRRRLLHYEKTIAALRDMMKLRLAKLKNQIQHMQLEANELEQIVNAVPDV